jgi:hypothetical protein
MGYLEARIMVIALHLGPCHVCTPFIPVILVHEVYLDCPLDIHPHANLSGVATQRNNLAEAR